MNVLTKIFLMWCLVVLQLYLCVLYANFTDETDSGSIVNIITIVSASAIMLLNFALKGYSTISGKPYSDSAFVNYLAFGFILMFFGTVRICLYARYVHEMQIMAVANSLVLVGLMALNMTMGYHEQRDDRRARALELDGCDGGGDKFATTTTQPMEPKRPLHVMFVEGTSGLGKTTVCHKTFDFTAYSEAHQFYSIKSSIPFVQVMYDWHILLDTAVELMDFARDARIERDRSQDVLLIDRSFISQLAYSLLFECNGHFADPARFAADVDERAFNVPDIAHMIRYLTRRWFALLCRVLDDRATLGIQWFIATDAKYTAKSMTDRNGSDVRMAGMIPENYVLNQNYIFERLHRITGLGHLSSVYHINEGSILVNASRKMIKCTRFSC